MYRIIDCSSESSFHPAIELEANNVITESSSLGEGWSTSNYATFPQTLTLEFYASCCRLRRIIILSHESKISTSIELFSGLSRRRRFDEESISEARREANTNTQFSRLGHVVFATNEQTGYGAREQKSVSVNVNAR